MTHQYTQNANPAGHGLNRRDFLSFGAKAAGSAGILATMGGLQSALAATADTTGYKALVCLYLAGGNNGFNMIVPTTAAGYSTYQRSRSNLALAQSSLLPLTGTASDGYSYGLHGNCPELASLFNSGRMAILGNVGTLVQPTTTAQAAGGQVPLPLQLFSHSDQQTAWWTSIANRSERFGWAGRVADLYASQGYRSQLSMNINVGGANYWQEGAVVNPYVLGTGGAPTLLSTADTFYRGGLRRAASQDLLNQSLGNANMLVAEYGSIEANAASKVGIVNTALNAAGAVATPFPVFPGDNGLGYQFRAVANCIKARSQLGDSRQIFFVRLGGFDTHNNELGGQAALLNMVSKNVAAFWAAMGEIGLQNNVTLFSASDFGRSLGSNGDGSDHAWGNHHFILGGAVKPGWYGQMPNLAIGGPNDMGAGRIVPTTSTDQYSATLARWFGVADSDLTTVFPNLGNFPTRTLGFL